MAKKEQNKAVGSCEKQYQDATSGNGIVLGGPCGCQNQSKKKKKKAVASLSKVQFVWGIIVEIYVMNFRCAAHLGFMDLNEKLEFKFQKEL